MSWCPFGARSSAIIMHDPGKPVQEYHNVMQPHLKICVILVLMQINISWQRISLALLPLYTFFKVLYFIWAILHFYTLSHFFGGKGLKYFFFLLYWKDFTSVFQGGDSRPYWVLLNSKIEEWSHLVNLLVRFTCTLALKMEFESSSDTVASKVYIVIWNKVTLGEYL